MIWNLSALAAKAGRGLAVLLLGWALGCSHALRPPQITAGRQFQEQNLDRIVKGTPAATVRELLGEPLEIVKNGSGETWRYFVQSVQSESVRLLGALPLPGPKWTSLREATIMLVDGHVITVQLREHPPQPSNQRSVGSVAGGF